MPPVSIDVPLVRDQIRDLRDRLALTRDEFAAILQVTPSTVARWETAPSGVPNVRVITAQWLTMLASLPPLAFELARARIHAITDVGPWPAGWSVWTVVPAPAGTFSRRPPTLRPRSRPRSRS